MGDLIKFKKVIIILILVIAAIVGGGALLLGYKPAAKGFVLGSFFSLINFLVMAWQAPNRLGKEGKSATAHSALGLGLRLGLMALPLYAAFRLPEFNVIWTAIGIFNLQLSILIYGLVIERYGLMGDQTAQGR